MSVLRFIPFLPSIRNKLERFGRQLVADELKKTLAIEVSELRAMQEAQILALADLSAGVKNDLAALLPQFNEAVQRTASDLSDKLQTEGEQLRSDLPAGVAALLRPQAEQLRSDLPAGVAALLRPQAEQLRSDLRAELGALLQPQAEQLRSDLRAELGALLQPQAEQLRSDLRAELGALLQPQAEQLQSDLRAELGIQLQPQAEQLRSDLRTELTNVLQLQAEQLKSDLRAENSLNWHDTSNAIEHTLSSFSSRLRAVDGLSEAAVDAKNALAQFSGIPTRLNEIHQFGYEASNALKHLDTSLHSRLNTIVNEILPDVGLQVHQALAEIYRQLANRVVDEAAFVPHSEEKYAPASAAPYDEYLARAKEDFSGVFEAWKSRLETMASAFAVTKAGNAAHVGDVYSKFFGDFVMTRASGRVLDVGCGIFGQPFYLARYPNHLISGIEPLEQQRPPDFEVVRGISEYLPWPNDSFSTVISATSLDHCLSLDKSLAEIGRVLRPQGTFLLWIGSNAGAPMFDPTAADFVPADQFHLFHFDASWLEPVLENRFKILNRIELSRPSFSHVFYELSK